MPARAKSQASSSARRPRGTGSVRQRGSTWSALWFTTDPATGKREQHSEGGFKDAAEAQARLNERLAEVTKGTYTPAAKLTVAQLLDEYWIPVKRSEGLKPTTVAQYEDAAKWVKGAIGALPVEKLTPRTAAEMVERLRTMPLKQRRTVGLSPRSIQIAVGTLKAALAWAAAERLVSENRLARFKRPALDKAPVKAWGLDDARAFCNAIADDRLAAAWTLMISRGLRRGELAGLRWRAIDLAAGSLRVEAARVVSRGAAIDSTPKTAAGSRTVPLSGPLVALLQELRGRQAKEQEAAGDAYAVANLADGYVIADELGRPWHPDSISRRFDRLVAATGLPRLTPHGLRHTCATLMLADGVPTKVVSDMLGHSGPQITLTVYAHVMPGMAESAGERLDALLG